MAECFPQTLVKDMNSFMARVDDLIHNGYPVDEIIWRMACDWGLIDGVRNPLPWVRWIVRAQMKDRLGTKKGRK